MSFLGNEKFKSLTIQQIKDSLKYDYSFNKEMKENIALWLYDALKLYADDKWKIGNQIEICGYVSLRFKQTYEGNWGCATSNGNNPYAYIPGIKAYISYDLPNKLSFYIFKFSSNRGK